MSLFVSFFQYYSALFIFKTWTFHFIFNISDPWTTNSTPGNVSLLKLSVFQPD